MGKLRSGNLTDADWQQVVAAVTWNETLYAPWNRGGGSQAEEACAVEVGTFLSPTDTPTASQTVSLAMTDIPKAVIIWTAGQTAAGSTTGAIFGIGASAGNGNSATVGTGAADGVSDFTEDRNHRNDSVIVLVNLTGVEVEYADISSFAAGEFSLTWALSSAVAYRYHYLAIAGDDIVANVAQFVARTSAGTQDVAHGLAGVPSSIFGFSSHCTTAPPDDEGASAAHMSVFASDLVTDRLSSWEDATGIGYRGHRVGAAGHADATNQPNWRELSTITAADDTNVTFDWSAAATAEYYYCLFLRGIKTEVGNYTSAASATASTALSEIAASLHFGAMSAASANVEDDALLTVGASDGTNQASAGIIRDFGDTSADRFDSSTKAVAHYNNAAALQEDGSATHSGSDIDIAFAGSSVGSRDVSYLAFSCEQTVIASSYPGSSGDRYDGPLSIVGDWSIGFWVLNRDDSTVLTYPIAITATHRAIAAGGTNAAILGSAGFYDGTSVLKGITEVDDGEWHHIAITRSGNTGTVWIDGVSEASGTIAGVDISQLRFGVRSDDNFPLDGLLVDIVIEGTVWDEAAVLAVKGRTIPAGAYYFPAGDGTETQQSLTPLVKTGSPSHVTIAEADIWP